MWRHAGSTRGTVCVLGAIDRFAYREFPGEVQLIWYKDLSVGSAQCSDRLKIQVSLSSDQSDAAVPESQTFGETPHQTTVF